MSKKQQGQTKKVVKRKSVSKPKKQEGRLSTTASKSKGKPRNNKTVTGVKKGKSKSKK